MIRLIRSFPNEATVTDQRYDEIDGLTELNTLERDHYTGIREGRMINFPLSGKNTLEIGYKVTTYTHKVNVEYNLVSYNINQHIKIWDKFQLCIRCLLYCATHNKVQTRERNGHIAEEAVCLNCSRSHIFGEGLYPQRGEDGKWRMCRPISLQVSEWVGEFPKGTMFLRWTGALIIGSKSSSKTITSRSQVKISCTERSSIRQPVLSQRYGFRGRFFCGQSSI